MASAVGCQWPLCPLSGWPPTPDRLSWPFHFGCCNILLLLSSLYPCDVVHCVSPRWRSSVLRIWKQIWCLNSPDTVYDHALSNERTLNLGQWWHLKVPLQKVLGYGKKKKKKNWSSLVSDSLVYNISQVCWWCVFPSCLTLRKLKHAAV